MLSIKQAALPERPDLAIRSCFCPQNPLMFPLYLPHAYIKSINQSIREAHVCLRVWLPYEALLSTYCVRNWAFRDEKNAHEERDHGIREQLVLREGFPGRWGADSGQGS